ncbi:hypothetical protein PG989_006603 [Apiospora arundinis]
MGSFANFARRRAYRLTGFTTGYNFVLWFCLSGIMLGFCLARLKYLDFYGVMCNPDQSKPSTAAIGECFHLLRPLYANGMILHLAGVVPGGILAVVQFVPVVRNKALLIHQVNGYLVIVLALVGIAGGFIITRPTMGGQVDTQTATGFLGTTFLFANLMAYFSIKRLRIDLHRAWMIRAWVWTYTLGFERKLTFIYRVLYQAGSILSIRLIFVLTFLILPMTGTYYLSQPCDKLAWLFNDEHKTLAEYAECEAWFSKQNLEQRAHVRAEWLNAKNLAERMTAMNISYGVASWIGLAIHIMAVEVYLNLTSAEAQRLRKMSIKRRIEAGMQTAPTNGELNDVKTE